MSDILSRDSDELSQFCQAWYQQEAVKSACLTLQDGYGVNVNLVLFALWSVDKQWELGPEQFRMLNDAVSFWHENQLRKIRQLRHAAKQALWLEESHRQNLYQKLLDSELAMEHIEQRMLVEKIHFLSPPIKPGASASQAIWNYLLFAGVPYSQETQRLVEQIVNGH